MFAVAIALADFKQIEAEFLCERLRKARLASSRLTRKTYDLFGGIAGTPDPTKYGTFVCEGK